MGDCQSRPRTKSLRSDQSTNMKDFVLLGLVDAAGHNTQLLLLIYAPHKMWFGNKIQFNKGNVLRFLECFNNVLSYMRFCGCFEYANYGFSWATPH